MARDKNSPFFTDSINSDMALMEKNRKRLLRKSGAYAPAAWLDWVTQFNAYMGHPRRKFTPIIGKFIL